MVDIIRFIPFGLLLFFISRALGYSKASSRLNILDAKVAFYESELHNYELSYKEQQRKYDELYDSLLRVNKYNSELVKRLQESRSTYEELADEIYGKFVDGVSRKELCTQYPNVGYSTLCQWIRKKAKEYSDKTSPANSEQSKLF